MKTPPRRSTVDRSTVPPYRGKRARLFSSIHRVVSRAINRSADRRKVVGRATIVARRKFLMRVVDDLHANGYALREITNLKPKHVHVLMRYWESRGLSASTLQNRFSMLRWLCQCMGKASMLESADRYLDDPVRFERVYVAQQDQSWSAQAVDIDALIDTVAAMDTHAAMVLKLQRAFGLRLQEASLLRPERDREDAVLNVISGTKGGRRRVVPIVSEAQRQLLDEAEGLALQTQGSIIPSQYDLRAWLKHCYYVFSCCGISRRQGRVAHGLRHQYANDRFEALAGTPSRVRGGEGENLTPTVEHRVRGQISQDLGHAREQITNAYCGQPVTAIPRRSAAADPELQAMRQALDAALAGKLECSATDPGQRLAASTIEYRRKILYRCLADWRAMGLTLGVPDQLSDEHLSAMIALWQRRGLRATTCDKQVAVLKQLCHWLDKPELVEVIGRSLRSLDASPTG